jgi:hypothetical protein
MTRPRRRVCVSDDFPEHLRLEDLCLSTGPPAQKQTKPSSHEGALRPDAPMMYQRRSIFRRMQYHLAVLRTKEWPSAVALRRGWTTCASVHPSLCVLCAFMTNTDLMNLWSAILCPILWEAQERRLRPTVPPTSLTRRPRVWDGSCSSYVPRFPSSRTGGMTRATWQTGSCWLTLAIDIQRQRERQLAGYRFP